MARVRKLDATQEEFLNLRAGGAHRVFDDDGGCTYTFAQEQQGHIPIICCTCGLAHMIVVELQRGEIRVTISGHDDLTQQARETAGVLPVVDGGVSDALAVALNIE